MNCKVKLVSGKKKGEICGRSLNNEFNCQYHKNKPENQPSTVEAISTPPPKQEAPVTVCKATIKSGPNKDKECGKTNCHIHKTKNDFFLNYIASLEDKDIMTEFEKDLKAYLASKEAPKVEPKVVVPEVVVAKEVEAPKEVVKKAEYPLWMTNVMIGYERQIEVC